MKKIYVIIGIVIFICAILVCSLTQQPARESTPTKMIKPFPTIFTLEVTPISIPTPTLIPIPSPEIPIPIIIYDCNGDVYNCSGEKEVPGNPQEYLKQCPDDQSKLDNNNDGNACEG